MTVHKPNRHDSAPLHVSGAARYTDDVPLPMGTLHLAFGTSPIAAGTLTRLDLAPVRAADGVLDVLTAQDLPHANDVSPSPVPEPFLAVGTVHYIGQPLFLVIADTHLNARKAARLAGIEIAETPPILTIDDALAADS
ncbi:MAG: xanthine dehydrogenase molybdopterin binding subunit, partial [Pseudomonadota bacterium]